MTKLGKAVTLVLLAGLLLASIISCGPKPAKTATTWTFYHIYPPAGVQAPIFQWFRDEVAKRSDGRLVIEEVGAGALGLFGGDALDGLVAGNYQMYEGNDFLLEGSIPIAGAQNLPFLAETFDQARKVNEIFQEKYLIPAVAEKWPVTQLWYWVAGPHHLHSAKPIKGLDDLKGYKIRLSSPIQVDVVQKLGMIPVTIPGPEVYISLQRGVFDGAVSAAMAGSGAKWSEVAQYLYTMSIASPTASTWVSNEALDSLPKDVRKIVLQTAKEAMEALWKAAEETDYALTSADGELATKFGVQIAPMPEDVLQELREESKLTWQAWAEKDASCQAFLAEARKALNK